jgi:hypothetical protein
MFSHLKWALVVPVVGTTFAQEPGKKDVSRPQPAEVRLHDGSLVRMTILQESVDIQTKYGKLTIPLRDIRRIEFGLHLPDGAEPQIQEAIKQMGSGVYKERDEAVKQLVAFGPMAYPQLQKATRSPDPEVVKRAVAVIKRIDDKIPPEQLRLKPEDSIQTAEFSITGRVLTPGIKVHSETFGEITLKLCQLRSLAQRGQAGDVEVNVDAAQFGTSTDIWMDSGVSVDSGLKLIIRSEGQVDLWPQGPGQYMTTPKGYSTAGKGGVYMAGTLLGKVGDSGKIFVIGESYEGVAQGEGRLFFHIVPSPWNNTSSGNYRVRVRTDFVGLSSK